MVAVFGLFPKILVILIPPWTQVSSDPNKPWLFAVCRGWNTTQLYTSTFKSGCQMVPLQGVNSPSLRVEGRHPDLKVLVGTIIISHEIRIPSFSPHQFFSRNVCHVRSAWWVLKVVDGVFCTNSAFAPRLRYQIVFLFMLEGLSCTQEPRSLGIRSDIWMDIYIYMWQGPFGIMWTTYLSTPAMSICMS